MTFPSIDLEPLAVTAMRQFKAELLAAEAIQMHAMAGRWIALEESLMATIEALAARISSMHAAGEVVSPWRLMQLKRYRQLLAQAEVELERYVLYAADLIADQQMAFGIRGINNAVTVTELSFEGVEAMTFNRLPTRAIENMVGLTKPGMPVADLLRLRMVRDAGGAPLPGVAEKLTQTLLDATVQGWNPRRTANLMRDNLSGGLNKAMQIARSEQMRVYRQANVMQYRHSGVVQGQKRLCAHDGRVCGACLADEGTVYLLSEPIEDHTSGRCVGVPIVSGMPEPRWTSGEVWFAQQDESMQRSILGPGRLEAFNAGAFEFSDLVTRQHDPTWGGSITVTPLRDLVAQ